MVELKLKRLHKMKQLTKTIFFSGLLLVGALGVALFASAISPAPAYAAPPKCFDGSVFPELAEQSCPTTEQLAFFGKGPLNDDKCYTVSGNTAAVSITVSEHDCAALLALAIEQQEQNEQNEQELNNQDNQDDTLKCDNGQEGVQISNGDCVPFSESDDNLAHNPIIKYLGIVINFLLAGVGIVVTMVIVIAGYQYMTSQGNPQSINAAKDKIFKAVISLIAYIFAWAIINWVVPGGIL